jgi:hypothetical protein
MPPRTIGRLTQKQVINAKPPEGKKQDFLADGGNLYLELRRGTEGSVSRSWIFRYELDGDRHDLGLGPLHSRSLREARTGRAICGSKSSTASTRWKHGAKQSASGSKPRRRRPKQ